MLIQLKPQYLTIFELELELLAIEPWIILVDNPMVVGACFRLGLSYAYATPSRLSCYSLPGHLHIGLLARVIKY